jgi:hypothetical protein
MVECGIEVRIGALNLLISVRPRKQSSTDPHGALGRRPQRGDLDQCDSSRSGRIHPGPRCKC